MFEGLRYFNRKNLILYLTSACNLRCMHCFYFKKINKVENVWSIEKLRKILPALPLMRNVIVTGGEPLLREDLFECVELLMSCLDPEEIELDTNGSYPDRLHMFSSKYLDKFKNKKLLIQLSLLGSESVHDSITRERGSFKKLDAAVMGLQENLRAYSNLDVIFCVPIIRNNYKDISFFFEYSYRNNIKLKFSHLKDISKTVRLGNRELLDANCSIENQELGLTYDEASSFVDAVEVESKKYPDWVWPKKDRLRNRAYLSLLQGKSMGECYFRRNTYTIFSNGDYTICDLLKPVGNLLMDGALNNRSIRDCIKESSDCFCTHGEYIFKRLLCG